jgi:UDP-N-acetylglucosamine--N-acetylmuramyl-(pentapeptide) pyrophosphoryl-undecaprenol N-acetylglucosamine transferase
VPLPHALDQDQAANAAHMEKAGGGIPIRQDAFTPDRLAAELDALAADPARLTAMAQGATSLAVPDAAEKLADVVLRVGGL